MSKTVRASIVIGVGLGWLTSAAAGGTWAPTMELGGSIFGGGYSEHLFPTTAYMQTVGPGTYTASGAGSVYETGPHSGSMAVTYPAAYSASQSNPIVIEVMQNSYNLSTTFGAYNWWNVNMTASLNEPGSTIHYLVEWAWTYTLIEGGFGAGTGGVKFETGPAHSPWYAQTFYSGTASGSFTGTTTNGVLRHDGIGADFYQGQGYAGHGILQVTYRIYADTVPVPAPSAGLALLTGLGIVGTRRRR